MTDVNSVARAELRSFIERIERLEEEKAAISGDIKDVKGEAKGRGYDVGAINTIIKLRKKDANERAEEEAILDTYMAALGMIDQPSFFDEPHDRETGEITIIDRDDEDGNHLTVTVDARVAAILSKSAAMPLQSPRKAAEAVSERAATMVDHASGLAEAGVSGQPEMIPALTGQFPGVNVDGAESAGVTGGESAATNSPSDDDAIAAVKGNARLANVTDVEPSSSAPIATASQGEAEAPSVERVSPQAETDTGSAAANTGGDHVTDHQSFAAQAGASVQVAPAKILRPHCRTPKMCGSGTIDHCHSCKVAMREREMA
jgi:uncharacterized protein (UPF0335 family)